MPSSQVYAEAIPFAILSPRKMRASIMNNMKAIMKEVRHVYGTTIQTWENEKPNIIPYRVNDRSFKYAGGNLIFEVGVEDDGGVGYTKWTALDEGFTRYTILSPDWKSKTWIDRIQANYGQGTVFSGSLKDPRQVLPRKWHDQIYQIMYLAFLERIDMMMEPRYDPPRSLQQLRDDYGLNPMQPEDYSNFSEDAFDYSDDYTDV